MATGKTIKNNDSKYYMINKQAIYLTVYKRSRGPAENKAMFAKMGAAGKLRKKVGGKRTGEELPVSGTKPSKAKTDSVKIREIAKKLATSGGNPTPRAESEARQIARNLARENRQEAIRVRDSIKRRAERVMISDKIPSGKAYFIWHGLTTVSNILDDEITATNRPDLTTALWGQGR